MPLAIDDPFHFDYYPELDKSDSLTLQISFFSQLVFDPIYLTISLSLFPEYDWSAFYGDIKGAILSDMPDPLGNDADDSDLAEDKRIKCFQNGSSIFCNRTLIEWVSISPPTFDTSVLVLLLLLCNTALKG